MTIETISGVARSAMLVTLTVGVYSGRKMDRSTQAEVVAQKNSGSARAASVFKSLFADCSELDSIIKFQARARTRHYQMTLPWQDNGSRLLPSVTLLDYRTEMAQYENEFNRLVDVFLDKYDVLVAAAAFKLGSLFDRAEYPTRDKVSSKFRFDLTMAPLPTSGDFRLDVEHEVQEQLARDYEKRMAEQLAAAQQDSWRRMYDVLARLKDRLTLDEDGSRRKFHDTTVFNAVELCSALTALNVTRDPELERARVQLEKAMNGVTPEELRKVDSARAETLHNVERILDAFDWGTDDDV